MYAGFSVKQACLRSHSCAPVVVPTWKTNQMMPVISNMRKSSWFDSAEMNENRGFLQGVASLVMA